MRGETASRRQPGDALPLLFPSGTPGHHRTKLARSVYSGRIAASLREAIIGGELSAGAPLVEARLAEQLAVSRGPIRSALHVLEGEGLARTLPNGRMVVVGFGADDVRDLLRVRFKLELVGIAWGTEDRRDTVPIQTAFDLLCDEGASTEHLVELDVEFHRSLVAFSGSRFLVQSWLALAPLISAVIAVGNRTLAFRDPRSNFERIVESHRTLVEAVVAHDFEAAERTLTAQFDLTESMFVKNTPGSAVPPRVSSSDAPSSGED